MEISHLMNIKKISDEFEIKRKCHFFSSGNLKFKFKVKLKIFKIMSQEIRIYKLSLCGLNKKGLSLRNNFISDM